MAKSQIMEMTTVGTDSLKEGMLLSEDVRDINGRLLLKKGQKIKSNYIKILKMWGVTEVKIVGEASIEEDPYPAINPLEMKEITENTKRDFRHVDLNHPAMSELFRLSVLFRSQDKTQKVKKNTAPLEFNESTEALRPDIYRKIMQQEIKLPELPSVIFELNEIMADPFSSSDDIAQVILKSPSLATVLLKIVNSSFYGFPSQIDSISRAITIIGTKEVGIIALGITVMNVFEDIPPKFFDMDSFRRHCFACGIISRIMAAQKAIPKTEQLFASGLLHEIGRMVVYKYFPTHASLLLTRAAKSRRPLHQEEKEVLGCRHSDLNRLILKKWKLPFTLVDNISCLHNPSTATDPVQATIVHMADIIATGLGLGCSVEPLVPPLDDRSWNAIGLPPSCLGVVVGQAADQLSAFETLLTQNSG